MFSIPMKIEKSTFIAKPVSDVFAVLADFNQYKHWSPWQVMEPGVKISVKGEPGRAGHSQSWEGELTGVGTQTIASINKNKMIDLDLSFVKPWKSQSKVFYKLEETKGGTTIYWMMDGTLPFFMFFFKKMMTAFVGNDFERGLRMLKEYLETGKVLSKVDIKGQTKQSDFYYVGIQTPCTMSNLGPTMEKDYKTLEQRVKNGDLPNPDFGFSMYKKFDMVTGDVEYISGFGYWSQPKYKNSDGLVTGKMDGHHALEVDHFGSYNHLGNGWSSAYSLQRSKKLKMIKNMPGYEIYKTMPGQVPDEKIHTQIFIPIK